ncbi:hypothetical protein SAMN02990966_01203 [Rhodospirillales bacterium URHD0017]|nr:hypothetical protein SAMN02990966_01203 [Rhodospirillales bacterium URHD0017]
MRLGPSIIASAIIASAILAVLPLAAQAQQPAAQQVPSQNVWGQLPRMQLDRQFAGPLQDTIVQRWRDPVDGTVCYLYLPITASHSPVQDSGYVQYGANTIGSISCMAPVQPPLPPANPPPGPARSGSSPGR